LEDLVIEDVGIVWPFIQFTTNVRPIGKFYGYVAHFLVFWNIFPVLVPIQIWQPWFQVRVVNMYVCMYGILKSCFNRRSPGLFGAAKCTFLTSCEIQEKYFCLFLKLAFVEFSSVRSDTLSFINLKFYKLKVSVLIVFLSGSTPVHKTVNVTFVFINYYFNLII
jgi:hypothetical protein